MAIFFGIARRNITPTVPVALSGYFNVRMWDHVLDDLWVYALVLRDERTTAAIVQLDVVGVPEDLVQQVRYRLADVSTQLPPEHVLITCTHTHTAPAVQEKEAGSSRAYIDFLADQIALSVREALNPEHQRPADIGFTRASGNAQLAFCRRYHVRDRGVITNPPREMRPVMLGWEGAVDDEIGVLSICSDGRVHAVLANIVNHADTIGGTGVSGDWPGLLRDELRRRMNDPDLFVMPLTGCSGDVAHVNAYLDREWFGYAFTRELAEGYAQRIAAAISSDSTSAAQPFAVAHTTFTTGPREMTDETIAQARVDVNRNSTAGDGAASLTAFDLATRSPAALRYFAETLLKVAAERTVRQFEVIGIRLGDVTLISLPGEPFCAFQFKIKHDYLQNRPCIVVSHGNGLADYIAMPHHYANGGYETEPAVSWLSEETGDRMLKAVRATLDELKTEQRTEAD